MASSAAPAMYQLPEELLLLVASQLSDSGQTQCLKNLALVSRTLRPPAQEALHAIAKLTVTCGCHPKVNAMLRLLRTLLDRPDLARKVRVLRFRAVRRNIGDLYESQGFELSTLRTRSLLRLQELGYAKGHSWWRSIENFVESAFAGLLLVQIPNLVHADFWVKDHQRGPPSSECITGLFGCTFPPAVLAHSWRGIRHLTLGDTHMLKCGLELPKLTSLNLKTVSIGTLLRLNGPGCLQGTEHLRKLALTCSIQFADRLLVEKADVQFCNIIDALGCLQLSELMIQLVNDGYHIGDDLLTELDTGYFIDQLCKVEGTLETLAITLEMTDDESELEWLLGMCSSPRRSFKNFESLKRLIIPEAFLFTTITPDTYPFNYSCLPKDLPANLESLEILYPSDLLDGWIEKVMHPGEWEQKIRGPILQEGPALLELDELVLTCRDEVNMSASYCTERLNYLWPYLIYAYGIECIVDDQSAGIRVTLSNIIEYPRSESFEESSVDSDDDMPDLIDPVA